MSKRLRSLVLEAIAASAVFVCAPRLARAQAPSAGPSAQLVAAPAPGPREYHVETRPAAGLFIAGTIVLGAGYGTAVTALLGSNCSNDGWLALPVAGPFLTSARYRENYEGKCDDPEGMKQALAGFDGVVQSVGAVLLVTSVLFPSRRLVPNTETVSLQFAPLALSNKGAGVEMLGTF